MIPLMYDWVIIDGYSLLHAQLGEAVPHGPAFDQARDTMVNELIRIQPQLAKRLTLVFDGQSSSKVRDGGVEIRFTSSGKTADAEIEAMVFQLRDPRRILVVSSDHGILDVVSSTGCGTQRCPAFISRFQEEKRGVSEQTRRLKKRVKRPTLGDFFPKD
jgi:predicted RNA-binding protein with PIN domain